MVAGINIIIIIIIIIIIFISRLPKKPIELATYRYRPTCCRLLYTAAEINK